MSSINTNIGAYSAQQNLRTANAATVSSIGKLSSGNRIQRAADDVAGLSVGTILATNVNTLKTGLANAGQANSLLQVADGGLKNITSILQRQKALSVAATSGILSAAERGYLDQEFQNLTSEIDRLVGSTKFNSVKLLDGSLSKQVELTSNVLVAGANGTAVTGATVLTVGGIPDTGGQITVAGVSVTFTTGAVGSADAAGKVVVGESTTITAQNIARFLNESGDARLANFYFTNTADVLNVEWGGGLQNGAIAVASGNINATNITIPASAASIANGASDVDGLGRARVFGIGSVAGSLLNNGDTAATGAGEAITLNTVERTANFVGKIGGETIGKFGLSYTAADTAIISLKVGAITYTSDATDLFNATTTAVTLTGRDDNALTIGGSFILNFRGTAATNIIQNQADADIIAEQINDAFKDVTFVQNRDIRSFKEGAVIENASGAQVLNLDGTSANFRSDNFSSLKIGGFRIVAPGIGETDSKISVLVNGEEYRSYSGIGNKMSTNAIIALQNVNDPNKALSIVLSSTALAGQAGVAADFSTQENANVAAAALDAAFGVQDGQANLNFQIGATSSDSIGVTIDNAGSKDLFDNNALSLKTVIGANAASVVLDEAIARVTSLRANIGALQSRFDFASANLETAIANTDAARSNYLDANISEESTNFAQAQVKLQASISVLAQANQLPQNLLKLIG